MTRPFCRSDVRWCAILAVLLLCALPSSSARRPRTPVRTSNNNIDLNNPSNPASASYHSLYNGPGNGNGNGNGLDGDPAHPRGKSGNYAKPGSSGGSTSNGISYRGGPVMVNGVTAYVIWYGNWAGSAGLTIIPDFLSNLGGTPWWAMSTTYYDSSANKIKPTVTLGQNYTDNYSQGPSLTDTGVLSVVANAINNKWLPNDSNGVYFVLTSPDVAKDGFCTSYCGWHTYANIGGSYIKYSFVGNPANCMSACSSQTISPNGDAGVDAMISVIAHELTEAASDPLLNAWYDRSGYENADKCAWTYGTQSTAANGSKYNVVIGSRQYLVQRNWVNAAGGYCALAY